MQVTFGSISLVFLLNLALQVFKLRRLHAFLLLVEACGLWDV